MRKKAEAELLALLPEFSEAEKYLLTRDGLTNADAGRTITREEVLRWMDEQLVKVSEKPRA